MTSTTPGTRSFFLNDFSDETVPCEPTLEGWAQWLAEPDLDDGYWQGDAEFPIDGSAYKSSAILWSEDIIARKNDGRWTLSRPIHPEETFFAVRFGPGAGWDADNIIYIGESETRHQDFCAELAELLGDSDEISDGEEYIAVGRVEGNWIVTFHAGPPPTCTAERSN
ncbi:MAG: hypothetical protein Q8R81_09610 [Novosphingobium sp.]|uniref:hypothetical protein n=1 Tax=Novosphingobium sp. TaxID=1874826 RepID=UPI0027350A59|nr:hypothetical protein [Novosphingobium sp.]MDP3550641.1 hypothetical protein [Novosphingobium sp.]